METAPHIPLRSEAFQFVLIGLGDWAPIEQRILTVQALLDVAGFDAKATCAPDFRQLWPVPCEGLDGKEASEWLDSITSGLIDIAKTEDRYRWVTPEQTRMISESVHWQREKRGLNAPKG